MQFDRRLLHNFSWGLLLFSLLLSGIGLANLASTAVGAAGTATPVHLKQAYWLALGLAAFIFVALFDHRTLERWAYVIYGACLALLIVTLVLGQAVKGSQRWLDLGLFRLQPSEVMKIGLIIAVARYFKEEGEGPLSLRDLLVPLLLILPPVVLILKQPDLGTAAVLMAIAVTMLLFIGVRLPLLIAAGGLFLGGLPLAWFYLLKDYQKHRIITLFNPEADPLGKGYHIIQSKIAIGSGGVWGKGFLQGTQGQLKFLPEQRTDFAFAVFAEQWGFVGTAVLLALYFLLLIWCIGVARESRDRFGTLLVIGLTAFIAWHAVVNLAMVAGLLPVVGIPLPFLSYGGSSMITVMIALGLIQGVSMRRFMRKGG